MFNDDKFKVIHTVDKRGKPVVKSSTKDLEEYYELESDEEEKESIEKSDSSSSDEETEIPEQDQPEVDAYGNAIIKSGYKIPSTIKEKLQNMEVDYLRGEGVLLTDSSSDEEDSDQEDDLFIEHVWGELDRDAETTEESSNRLAACHMDWDRIRAVDIMVLCNSFLPPGTSIRSVKVRQIYFIQFCRNLIDFLFQIYPSEFGKQRIAEEEIKGPRELTNKTEENNSENEEVDEQDVEYREKLREYQLNRLKYYYAVIEFDSVDTAEKVYKECDGLEYESTANKLDLRFIPDDMEFEDDPKDVCTEFPDMQTYKPRLYFTTALQQAKVELTWDENDVERKELTDKLFSNKISDIKDAELRKFVACSSEEENESGGDDEKSELESDLEIEEKSKGKNKLDIYKNLLDDIKKKEDEKKQKQVEMEFTWGIGIDSGKSSKEPEIEKTDELTPFEKILEKKKTKKKAKKEARKKKIEGENDSEVENGYSSDDFDVDMNDPFFAEEFADREFEKPKKSKNKSKKKSEEVSDEQQIQAEQELALLLDDGDDDKAHFSLKKIQEKEEMTKSKKKRKLKKSKQNQESNSDPVDNFALNINDNRFAAVYTSADFNIDPSDPHFKKTKGMETLIHEKLKRRTDDEPIPSSNAKKPKKDISMNLLVKNIKRKVQQNQ